MNGQIVGSQYGADRLSEFDVGLRWRSDDDRLSLDGALFAARWTNVQADFLTESGLVTTRNAGNASNGGVDLTVGWRPAAFLRLAGGILAQHPRIDPGAVSGADADRRLPVVPDIAGHAELVLSGTRLGWRYALTLRGRYVGEAKLSFDPQLDRPREPMVLLAGAISAQDERWAIRLGIENIGNSRGDSFSLGNPFTVSTAMQRTPVRPRTITLSVRRSW